jgi:hypothetical protein
MKDDFMEVLTKYNRQVGVSLSFKQKYGEASPSKVYAKAKKSLEKELSEKVEEIRKSEPDAAKAALKTQKLKERALRDLEDIKYHIDSVAGINTEGAPSQFKDVISMLNSAQRINLASSALASTSELSIGMYRRMMSKMIVSFSKSFGDFKGLTSDEWAELGLSGSQAMTKIMHERAAGAIEQFALGKTATTLQSGVQKILKGSGVQYVQQFVREFAGNTAMRNAAALAEAIGSGKVLTKKQLALMNDMELTPDKLLDLKKTYDRYKTVGNDGVVNFNINTWALKDRQKLAFLHRQILITSTEFFSETAPKLLSTGVGKALFAFKSFIFSFTQQTGSRFIQRSSSNPGETAALMGVLMFGSMMSIMARDVTRGKDPTERFKDPDAFALQVLMYSGILGVMGDVGQGAYGTFVNGDQDAMIKAASPLYGKVKQLQDLTKVVATGEASEKEINSISGLLGTGSIIYTAGLSRYIAKELGEE